MKKLLFGSLIGLALIMFTGCTTSENADAEQKCQSGKCQSDQAKAKKCAGEKQTDAKCQSGEKCGK
ncbi:hypothetical protein ACM66Z_00505 [Sulfurovum sp. ST-21]|uniref:Lipoprotein n=1 Tax=Sulfurovum indicum TaxID=2779528 RepID=A0A7M1S3J7_9BACT|nr:hypothetical protein [Sulfurovum indicum]QOR62005.1 hypothetical protein IMZ28_00505 [Sulfurovum indicum]